MAKNTTNGTARSANRLTADQIDSMVAALPAADHVPATTADIDPAQAIANAVRAAHDAYAEAMLSAARNIRDTLQREGRPDAGGADGRAAAGKAIEALTYRTARVMLVAEHVLAVLAEFDAAPHHSQGIGAAYRAAVASVNGGR